MSDTALLDVRDLVKTYDSGEVETRVLKGLSMTLDTGESVALLGPSGSGKSTLLYLLGGLDHASSGEILVGGARLDGMTSDGLARFRRETVGFIFQAFHLVPTMTALENVALPGVFAAMPRDVREQRALQLLNALGMAPRLDHKPSQLSGGQQQRVAIARALFGNPPVIMADEPTGALDSRTGQTVMQMLRTLCTRQGKTVLVVTHDLGVAQYADRMIQLKDGRIVEDTLMAPKEKTDAA